MNSSLVRYLYYIGGVWLLFLSACSTGVTEGAYYAFERLPNAQWRPKQPRAFDLLFTERGENQTLQLILRMDGRLDRPDAQLGVRLSYRGETILRDTLSMSFALRQGEWTQSGVVVHTYAKTLAHPLYAPHTGLYTLEVSLLDSVPLNGITQIGIHTQRQHAE